MRDSVNIILSLVEFDIHIKVNVPILKQLKKLESYLRIPQGLP